jgi:hypothetical protein
LLVRESDCKKSDKRHSTSDDLAQKLFYCVGCLKTEWRISTQTVLSFYARKKIKAFQVSPLESFFWRKIRIILQQLRTIRIKWFGIYATEIVNWTQACISFKYVDVQYVKQQLVKNYFNAVFKRQFGT